MQEKQMRENDELALRFMDKVINAYLGHKLDPGSLARALLAAASGIVTEQMGPEKASQIFLEMSDIAEKIGEREYDA